MSNILQALESTWPCAIFLTTAFIPALITFSIEYYNNLITILLYKVLKDLFIVVTTSPLTKKSTVTSLQKSGEIPKFCTVSPLQSGPNLLNFLLVSYQSDPFTFCSKLFYCLDWSDFVVIIHFIQTKFLNFML